MDSVFENTEVAIWSRPPNPTEAGTSVITLDNIGLSNVGIVVWFTDGSAPLLSGNTALDFFVTGDIQATDPLYGSYGPAGPDRPATLTAPTSGPWVHAHYFERRYEKQHYSFSCC